MRRPAVYPPARYRDPNDRKMIRTITHAKHSVVSAVNILGIPFDGAVLGRKGARDGPAAIRREMSGFSSYSVDLGVSLDETKVVDLGDLEVGPEVSKAHRQIEEEVSGDLKASSLLLILGGDNSVSLPSLRAYAEKFGRIGLVVIDSHFDLRGKIGGRASSGSSYGLAIETLPQLDPRRVVEIGTHGFLNSEQYVKKAERLGIEVVTAKEVRERGPRAVAREAFSTAARGARAVYLSVDLDAVDLAYVSGVSAPSAGGISSWELFEIVHEITRKPKVKCLDLVELSPSLDPTGRSQVVAATALMYAIAGFRSRGPGKR